jgi:hypothetical protein
VGSHRVVRPGRGAASLATSGLVGTGAGGVVVVLVVLVVELGVWCKSAPRPFTISPALRGRRAATGSSNRKQKLCAPTGNARATSAGRGGAPRAA